MYPVENASCQATARCGVMCGVHAHSSMHGGERGERTTTVHQLCYCCASPGLLVLRRALYLCM